MGSDNGAVNPAKRGGSAAILAIGTANPTNVVPQSTFPDFYFRITGNDNNTDLKEEFRAICEKSTIQKRHMHLTEEMLRERPNMCAHDAPSFDARHEIDVLAAPKLAASAAERAIAEWGRPRSDITHLVVYNSVGADMPGADCHLFSLLGLPSTVRRFAMCQLGGYACGTLIRMAKDVAENNPGARVLVVCIEMFTVHNFRGPRADVDATADELWSQAVFGDGVAALVIGAAPVAGVERPLFEIVSARQAVADDSEGAMEVHLRESGLRYSHRNSDELTAIVATNLELRVREEVMGPSGPVTGGRVDDMFWAVHPGSPGLIDRVREELQLGPDKLDASAAVLRDYGDMLSCTALFVLDEIRRRSVERQRATTGDGHRYGVLFSFGPGVTTEMVLLRSATLQTPPAAA